MLDPNSLIGKLLGNYRVLEIIGAGGFGYVYKGQHTMLDKIVAIKVLKAKYSEYDTQAIQESAALLHEVQIHQELKHPFILPLLAAGKQPLDANQQEGLLYMIMDYASGGSLHDRLDQHPDQPLPLQEALTILWQIGQALSYVHQHSKGTIAHRDLKPANILFNAQGDAMVADFGLATILSSGQTALIEVKGSLPYMSPEQFDGQVSVKSDQYALACIAYELLTGQRPFPGGNGLAWYIQHKTAIPKDPTKHNPALPAFTSQAILRALAKNRTKRYDTIIQFVEAMRGTQSPKSFNEWYQEGQRYYEARNFSSALAAYQEASRLYPAFADAYFNRGMALYQLQRYEQASTAFQQAIVCDPGTIKFYLQAGITFSRRGLFVEAVTMYQKVVQLDAQHKKACELLGDAYYELKHYEDAIQAYKQSLGLNVSKEVKMQEAGHSPDKARIYMNLGLVLKYCHKTDEALAAFECAINLNPGLAQAHYNKGNLLSDCGSYRPAVLAFDKAIGIDPKYVHAYRARSTALTNLGLPEEARLAKEMADRLEKGNA